VGADEKRQSGGRGGFALIDSKHDRNKKPGKEKARNPERKTASNEFAEGHLRGIFSAGPSASSE